MEEPLDEDNGVGTELVTGKKSGSGLKMSVIKVDLSQILDGLNDTTNVWVYESKLILKLKSDVEGDDPFKKYTTVIRPVNTSPISTDPNTLTEEDNLDPETGRFDTRKNQPQQDVSIVTYLTETIHKWINPSGRDYNEENNGFALVNEYEDGSPERTNAKDVRYYSYDESLPDPDDYPFIDICYKEVEVEHCEEGEEEVEIVLTDDVVIVKDSDGTTTDNYNSKPLEVGQDLDGDTKRILIKFDSDSFDTTKYDKDSVSKAWIHLHFIDYSEGDDAERSERTFNVYKVTEDWSEDTATWDNAEDISREQDPVDTSVVPEEQLGGTEYVIRVDDAVTSWIGSGEDNFGLVLIDTDEGKSTRIPTFKDKDTNVEQGRPKPTLKVCVSKIITTTTTTPTSTHTPSYKSTTVTPTPTQQVEIKNCTIPSGGKRHTIYIEDYIRIQDEPLGDDEEFGDDFIEIGKKPGKGEKVTLFYFDLKQAMEDANITEANAAITDSKFNLRLLDIDDGVEGNATSGWNKGTPSLHLLKHAYNDESTWTSPWVQSDGPVAGVDYDYEPTALFNKITQHPITSKWTQATITQVVRYFVTQSATYRKNNNGFALRFVPDDSSTEPNHEMKFASKNYPDVEQRPFMDICYLENPPPIKCEEGELVRFELTADTSLLNDGTVHGLEEQLLIGNSGWAGEARALIDFDSSAIPDSLELFSETESVYVGMYYEGSEMAQPYNDPRQMNRTLKLYKMIRDWKEDYATGKKRTKLAAWGEDLGSAVTDYVGPAVDEFEFLEEQSVGNYYWDITKAFQDWVEDPSTGHGFILKDGTHSKVPGHFLKFASKENSDPTKRPYIMACLKPQSCEPVDEDPTTIEDVDKCVSTQNVTLNGCVAKNGGCSSDVQSEYPDQIYPGTTAFWDMNNHHKLVTFCRCCVDATSEDLIVPMDCTNSNKADKSGYDLTLKYVKTCQCQMCQDTNDKREKREVPSRTRLLLRSALKSLLKK